MMHIYLNVLHPVVFYIISRGTDTHAYLGYSIFAIQKQLWTLHH
jgi:hypothetical protein